MKVLLLSGGSSIHTVRWANGLAKEGVEIHLVTQQALIEPVGSGVTLTKLPNFRSAGYFLMGRWVRQLAKKWNCDVLNAHYASGYGTAARFSRVRPYLLSVWGSDVYDFPQR